MMNLNRLPPETTEWIQGLLGSQEQIKSISQLKGSTSSDLYRIQIKKGTSFYNVVLRRLTNEAWSKEEPDLANHEAAALTLAQKSGLPVPEVIAYDSDGKKSGLPALIMTEVPGQVNLTPSNTDSWLRQMAAALEPIHDIKAENFQWQYFSYFKPEELRVPEWANQPKLWERAIEIVNQPPPPTRYCFIHRDYHPMNTLWQGSQLSGIVDWVNACIGPAPFDLAWNRLNLMQMYGVETAERLRELAQQTGGTDAWHPYWDVMAVCELLPGPPEVYTPWREFGLSGLGPTLLIQRAEEMLNVLLARQ